jgi:hypothetical protein
MGGSLCALALLALGACTAESTPASGPEANEYFPRVPGGRWVYSLRTSFGQLELEVTARGEVDLPGDRGRAFIMDESNLGPDLGFVETSPVAYVIDEAYLARISAVDYDATGKLRMLGRDEPSWVFPLDAKPGHTWRQLTGMFQNAEGGGGRLGWSGEVKPRTTITVPAGHFEDVLEIETHYRDASAFEAQADVIYRDYYARGVGLVRSVTEGLSGDPGSRVEQNLLEYHFPQ